MEVTMLQLPPGDSGLIDKIVCQLKSHGIFDQFRKECIADVDTKPAYQNLRQRVEGSVSSFLTNQEWRADLNKNQLRDSLRKHIHESGFLDIGVERIVDQVVNPKIYTVFFPKVEDVVYGFLGVEKPKKGADIQNSIQACTPKFEENPKSEKKFVSLIDLLPTDLDPISPEKLDSDEDIDENSTDKHKINNGVEVLEPNVQKVKVKEELISDVENDFDDEKDDEEDDDDEASPPFESLEGDAMDANATPPILPLHSADMLDNITSSSSSSETKDLLQYGEVRKRYPEVKTVLADSIKKEVDGESEKCLPTEQAKPETVQLNSAAICTIKKEEKEKKEVVEPRKDGKKVEKKEEKPRESGERKEESRSRKISSDTREVKDRHSYDKKRNDREQVIIKQEKDEIKRIEKEEQRKMVKEEHRRSEKEEHRKSEEVKKTDKEKDEIRKAEKGEKKHGEKDDARKVDKEKDIVRRHDKDKEDRKNAKERDDKDKEEKKNAKERDDKDKEDRKNTKERDEKRNDKDKKYVKEKDEHRKAEKEKDESRRSEKEKSDSRKRDKRDEKKNEKEKDEKKIGKEKDDSKKVERDESRRNEKDKNDKEKDKHRSGREKSEHVKGEKDAKDRVKSDHKEKESKHGSSKSGGENAKKDGIEKDHQSKLLVDKKKEDNLKKAHHRDSGKTGSSKDRRVGEKEKKVSNIDDHRHERDKGKNGHRRSDRDKDRERERSQADGATQPALGKEGSGPTSSTSSTQSASSDGTKGSGDNSSSGGGGGSERTKDEELSIKVGAEKEDKQEQKEVNRLEMYSCLNNTSGNLVLKIKKPKIAANIYEVKKIIQVRKNLKKLERERLVSSIAANQKAEEAVTESASTLESLNENKSIAEPPKVKRAKLGAVEQDLRVEVESVLEKGLLEGEDGEIGAVHYLEEYPTLPECISYVHSLIEEAASGDFTRVPSPTNSIATIELSDFEDCVILSDVELSKEEEEVVIKLGGQIERKSNKLKSPKQSSSMPPLTNAPEITGEASNKRPRRPNPRYNSGEYTVYSDEDVDDDDDMTDSVSQKKVPLVDGIRQDHWKTPKERNLEVDEDIEAISHHESSSGAALPTSENDAGSEDRETPVLSKRNQAAAEERRRMGRRLGVRGPLRRVVGVSPGTPDTFVMPLSPESDVSTASGDAGKKASLGTRAIENQYNQGDIDGELGPEDFDDDGDGKQPRLPLGPPLSSVQKGCDIRGHAGDMHQSHDDIGHPSSGLPDGEKRLDDASGFGPRRLRGTRSSSRVQQRYSSDDLYKPRPNITLGRRNRGRNSPTQDDSPNTVTSKNCVKRGRRGSSQGSEDIIVEGCLPNKRRRR